MAKPRKKKSRNTTAAKLQSYQNVQKMLSQTILGSCQYQPNTHITIHKEEIIDKPTYAMAQAFLHVKFHWKVVIGVLSRLPNNTHHVLFKTFYTDRHYFLEEIDSEMMDEAKDLFEHHSDHDNRLTTFVISCPNQDMPTQKLLEAGLLILHKYRVPDNMMTEREFRKVETQGYNDICRSFCNTTYWFNVVDCEEIVVEDV